MLVISGLTALISQGCYDDLLMTMILVRLSEMHHR